jgi:hypothetical protein
LGNNLSSKQRERIKYLLNRDDDDDDDNCGCSLSPLVARGDDSDDQSADERTRGEKRSSSQSKSRARKSINGFFVFVFFCGKKKDEEHDEKSNHGLDGFKRR